MTASLLGLAPEAWAPWERLALLLGPVALAGALVLAMRPTPREASAALLAFLWQMPSLLALNLLAREAGWWSFPAGPGPAVLGLPVDVWVGWAFLWGPVAALLERRVGIPVLLAAAGALDAATMPLLSLVDLSPGWLAGEPVFLALGLLPGLLLARWTRLDVRPLGRTLVHASGWGLYMLFALPAVALATEGRDLASEPWLPATALGWLPAAPLALSLLAGATAAFEFAVVGKGTPVPLDPPKRVVTTGPYAYVANPMQVTSALVMAILALHLRSPGLAVVTAGFLLFDAVYAAHFNKVHIARAMPEDWAAYKAAVPDWRIRWTPFRPGSPLLVANAAGDDLPGRLASDAGLRFRRRRAAGLARISFVCAGTGVRARGVEALSRVIERRNLAWAMLAWAMRLPVVLQVLQALTHGAIALRRRRSGIPLAPHRPRSVAAFGPGA